MEKNNLGFWFRLSLFSLAVVALYGALMRYKIAFDFPFFDQRNLLHAHSHFAFAGWISQLLYAGLALMIMPFLQAKGRKKYPILLALNFLMAAGMLIAFTIQGYKAVSILFSTLSIVVAVAYAWCFTRDVKYLPATYPARPWALAGIWFNVLSAAGPFTLAFMMATRNIHQDVYLASVYYYLHFQYNGWFFFGTMAIIISQFPVMNIPLTRFFRLFLWSCIPAYLLSTLWLRLPSVLYGITLIAAIVQLLAWFGLMMNVWPAVKRTNSVRPWYRVFFYAAALAITLKFILQAISAIPSLSQLVFGFRPIVIAYLHLVLLGVYSLFFIGFLFAKDYLHSSKLLRVGAMAFLAGVVLNELLLAIQGFGAFAYVPIPYIHPMLFAVAVLLWGSATVMAFKQGRRTHE